jgi:lipopolysaccharide transport system permease protein
MSASYTESTARVIPESGLGETEFTIRNAGPDAWKTGQDIAIGCQVFDLESGIMIAEGSRLAPGRDIAPGESCRIRLSFEIPLENGHYYVIASPLREGMSWFYEHGVPFLLIEASARKGRVQLEDVRVSSRRALRFRSALRSLGRAFTYPPAMIWRNRSLIRTMVQRDIQTRYRGSFGGFFWTIIHPLLLALTYFFIFGFVLRARFEEAPGRSGFALYFLAGLLPWLPFSEAAGRAPGIITEHRNFVKKLVFEVETLPVNLVISGLVSEFFALIVFSAALLVLRGSAPATAAWLPVLLIPQLLFTAGVVWLLAGLGVFVRDLGQMIGFLLTIWFFLTPICYPETSLRFLPDSVNLILTHSPIYVLVRGYRAILLEGRAPDFGALSQFWLLSVAVFVLGHGWFYKLRKFFADIV